MNGIFFSTLKDAQRVKENPFLQRYGERTDTQSQENKNIKLTCNKNFTQKTRAENRKSRRPVVAQGVVPRLS